MQVNIKNLISISDANKNFSKVAKMVESTGTAVILKNNTPRFVILDYNKFEEMQLDADEKIENIGLRIMEEYAEAFEALAK